MFLSIILCLFSYQLGAVLDFQPKKPKDIYHIMVPDLVGLNPAVDWVYYFFYEKIHMRSLPPPTGQKYSFLYTFQVRSSI